MRWAEAGFFLGVSIAAHAALWMYLPNLGATPVAQGSSSQAVTFAGEDFRATVAAWEREPHVLSVVGSVRVPAFDPVPFVTARFDPMYLAPDLPALVGPVPGPASEAHAFREELRPQTPTRARPLSAGSPSFRSVFELTPSSGDSGIGSGLPASLDKPRRGAFGRAITVPPGFAADKAFVHRVRRENR
jgi:hypothetical protein